MKKPTESKRKFDASKDTMLFESVDYSGDLWIADDGRTIVVSNYYGTYEADLRKAGWKLVRVGDGAK